MQRSTANKVIATLALLALLIAAAVCLLTSKAPPAGQSPAGNLQGHEIVQRQDAYIPPVRASGHVEPAVENDLVPAKPNLPAISREQIEAYLKLHNRNAASLLAAFHASVTHDTNDDGITSHGDTNYLMEAAANFPNDPHVQLTVLERDLFPEDRRKWLDAFKQSSPDNSLANYLSAQEYFKNGQSDAAIKELFDASDKEQFTDFDLENFEETEDLYKFSGQTLLEANAGAMAAMADELLPLLADMKRVAMDIGDVQKQYASSGDTVSVENLSQLQLGLADKFSDGDGSRFLISQLVGMAIESVALRPLDQNSAYDFLGGETPAQRLAELKQEKTEIRELVGVMPGFYSLPETEQSAYFDKMKTHGELVAMRWLQQEYPTLPPKAQ